MKLRHLFYDSTVNFRNVSISKVALAILIGICSSIVIYSFFYVLRESFRVMSIGFDYVPKIVSEENRRYYNLFFAGLSVIFGNSIALNFIFSKPQKITHRFNSKRKRLLNDNIFLSFNFSYWFAKIGLIFGVFSMCCMDFEFLPYFKNVSFLLLVVLYLESFKALGQLLNNSQRLKFYLIHFLCLLLVTFSLSKLNVVDYKGLDKMMLENNPLMDFPYSNFYNDDESIYRPTLQLKLEVEQKDSINVYSNDKKWALKDVPIIVLGHKATMREEMTPFLTVNLIADKTTKVNVIKDLELLMYSINQKGISYSVRTDDLLFSRFERRGIKKRITPNILDLKKETDSFPHLDMFYNANNNITDTIKIQIGENILFDNKHIENDEDLVNRFIQSYSKTTAFEYDYHEDTTYQDYIIVLAAHFSAVYKLRENKQTVFLNNPYAWNESYREEQNELKRQFPILVLEKFD